MNPFFDAAIKVAIVVGLALAAAALLTQRSAALRHWILAAGVVSAALAPVFSVMVPAWHAPIFQSQPPEPASVSSTVMPPASAPSATEFIVDVPVAASGAAPRIAEAQVIGTIWLAGSALCLGVLCVGLARLSWLASRARPIVRGPWPAIAGEVSRMYGLGRGVRLLQSDHPRLLLTWGFARPVVILPQAAHDWSEDRARIVLSHELAHIARGDWLAQMAAELLRAIFWFNPLMWIACRRLRNESERACDDAVLGGGIDGPDYAAELLALARMLHTRGERWFPAPAMARASSLEGRVAAMLNAEINRAPIGRKTRLATGIAVVALALAVAGFSASAQTFSSFSGTVSDQTGGALGGVTLSLINRDTHQKYEVRSNGVGSFEFVGLISGEYDLETLKPGFRSVSSRIIVAGKSLRQDVQLRVGSLEETITVVGRGDAQPAAATSTPRVRTAPMPKFPECVAAPGGGIRQPLKVTDVRPIYPPNLDAAKIDGVVVFNALVGTDGTIEDVNAVDPAAQPDLVRAATEAIRQWRFTPTLLNCVPIEVPMKITVNFKVE